ncbi:MAG: tetratricopeptide repeat protein [Bacteroidota bacterium]
MPESSSLSFGLRWRAESHQFRCPLSEQQSRKSVELQPDSPIPLINLGKVWLEKKKYHQAIDFYKLALDKNPGDLVDGIFARWQEALAALDAQQIKLEATHVVPITNRLYKQMGQQMYFFGKKEAALEALRHVVAHDPEDGESWGWLGEMYLRNGDLEPAEKALQQAIILDENNAGLRALSGKLKAQQGDPEAAISVYIKALNMERIPAERNKIFHDWLQVIQTLEMDEEECKQYLELADKYDSEPIVYHQLAQSLLSHQKYGEASRLYEKLLRDDPNHQQFRYEYAQAQFGLQHFDIAAAGFEQLMIERPDHDILPIALAETQLKLGKVQESLLLLRKAAEKTPDEAGLHEVWLQVLQYAGHKERREALNFSKLIAEYLEGREHHPQSDYFRNQLGLLLLDTHHLQEAEQEFRLLTEQSPDYHSGYNNLALVLIEQGNEEEAEALFQSSIIRFPDEISLKSNLGRLLSKQERIPEALAWFKEALDSPDPGQDLFGSWIIAFEKLDEPLPELADLEAALDKHLPTSEAYMRVGNHLNDNGQFDDAIRLYQKAMDANPDSEVGFYNLGLAWSGKKEPQKAIRFFEQALKRNPNDAVTHKALGDELTDLRKYDEAIGSYKAAIKLDPVYESAYTNWRDAIVKLSRPDVAIPDFEKNIREHRNDAAGMTELGRLYHNLLRFDQALKYFEAAEELDASHADIFYYQGLSFLALNQKAEAMEAFLTYEKKAGEKHFPLGYHAIALEYRLEDRLEDALAYIRKSLQKAPNNAWAKSFELNLSFLIDRNAAEAEAGFQALVREHAQELEPWDMWRDVILRSEHPERFAGRIDALANELNTTAGHFSAGLVLHEIREYEKAEVHFKQGLADKISFLQWDLHFSMGNLLLANLRYEEALEHFQACQKLETDNPLRAYAYHNVSFVHMRRGNFSRANQSWDDTLQRYEESQENAFLARNNEHFLYYGQVLRQRRRYQESEAAHLKALSMGFPNHAICISLVRLYRDWRKNLDGKAEKIAVERNRMHNQKWRYFRMGESLLKKAREKEETETLLTDSGELYLAAEEYEKATDFFKQSLQKNPESVPALFGLGAALVKMDEAGQAVRHLKKAVSMDPDNLDVQAALGEAYIKAGELNKAGTVYRRILDIAPDHMDTLVGLAETFIALGDAANDRSNATEAFEFFSEAHKHLTTALQANQNPDKRSKQFNEDERASLLHSLGYTKVRIYDTQSTKKGSWLNEAIKSFEQIGTHSDNYFKAQRAIAKIKENQNLPGQWSRNFGPRLFVPLAILFFLAVQFTYFVGKPKVSRNTSRLTRMLWQSSYQRVH